LFGRCEVLLRTKHRVMDHSSQLGTEQEASLSPVEYWCDRRSRQRVGGSDISGTQSSPPLEPVESNRRLGSGPVQCHCLSNHVVSLSNVTTHPSDNTWTDRARRQGDQSVPRLSDRRANTSSRRFKVSTRQTPTLKPS
jgi:hypothetical protein